MNKKLVEILSGKKEVIKESREDISYMMLEQFAQEVDLKLSDALINFADKVITYVKEGHNG